MKIGILTEGGRVAHWQAQALRKIAGDNEFVIFECAGAPSKRRPLAHALYYLLNLLAIRNRETAGVPLPRELQIADRFDFEAQADGAWQRLPESMLGWIADHQPAVILKFGMGLLRIPTDTQLACPILSYHHGDPREYRGRPAGFHELLAGKTTIGQVVQILSNQLDAGRIVSFAETKVHPHSYREALVEAYRCSPLILERAIENAIAGRELPIGRNGTNYRLPANRVVLGFMAKLVRAKLHRLFYGAFFEKA